MTDLTEVLARAARRRGIPHFTLDDAGAQIAALDAAGYQIVPKEPTTAMLEAVHFSDEALFHGADVSYAYAAMLEAAREGR